MELINVLIIELRRWINDSVTLRTRRLCEILKTKSRRAVKSAEKGTQHFIREITYHKQRFSTQVIFPL